MPLLLCISIGIISAPYFSLQPIMAIAGGVFLFFSGCEINLHDIRGEGRVISWLWLGAFLPPFFAGVILPFIVPQIFASPTSVSLGTTAFILGVAFAVSAVPVAIKIMQEMGWDGTQRARRVVFTAVLCDIAAWLLFFLVLPAEGHTPWLTSHWSLFMFFIGLILAAAWPDLPRPFSIFFKINKWFVGSIFFIGIGQALNFSLSFNTTQIVLVFVVATLSKTLGVWVMARFMRIPQEEAIALALALNARGAMEIIMAKFALNAGVITNEFFISLVIMALATSLIIKPIFSLNRLRTR